MFYFDVDRVVRHRVGTPMPFPLIQLAYNTLQIFKTLFYGKIDSKGQHHTDSHKEWD